MHRKTRLREYKLMLKQLNNLKKRTHLVHKAFILSVWDASDKFYKTMLKNKKMYEEIEHLIVDVKVSIKELKQ